MDEVLTKVQQVKCLTNDELEEIKQIFYKNYIRTPNCLKSESVESLVEIGINIRVAKTVLECFQSLTSTQPIMEPSNNVKVKSKDQHFVSKLEAMVEEEDYFKIQFELQNQFEVYDPISQTNIKLGSPYKISNVTAKLKKYKESASKKKEFEKAHSMIRTYLIDVCNDGTQFTITRDLMVKAEEHARESKKRKKEEGIQEKEKRQKSISIN